MGSLRKWLLAVAILLIAAGLVALGMRHRYAREHVLADGSVMRLAKVHFGKEERYHITSLREGVAGWFDKWMPKSWTAKLFTPALVNPRRGGPGWRRISEAHTNNDALWMYFTRRTAGSTNYQNVEIRSAELLDSHGCTFEPTQMGGFDDIGLMPRPIAMTTGMQSSVDWLRFEAFPRHEKEFRLRLYDQQHNFLTEFTVENPACTPMRPANWVVEPLPVSRTTNHVTFVLSDVAIKSNAFRSAFSRPPFQPGLVLQPTFKFLDNGSPTTAWQPLDSELWDSSGNFASKIWPVSRTASRPLCAYESAWKLRVKFYGSEAVKEASNVVWTIPKVKVPSTGEYVALDVRRAVFADQVDVLALAGPGKVTYSNNIPIKATSELPDNDGFYPISNQRTVGNNWTSTTVAQYYTMETVSFKTPHIAMSLTGLTNDERLTICATDEKGRIFYARNWMRRFAKEEQKPAEINYLERQFPYRDDEPSYYQLELPVDCKMVDLMLCVHYPFVEEFVFKPPQTAGKESTTAGHR